MKKLDVILGAIVVLAIVATVVTLFRNQANNNEVSLINSELLSSLQKTSDKTVDTSRLAEGLLPPTNTWYAGIALQETPQTVFPTPLSFTPTDKGFTYSLSKVQDTKDGIIASNRADVSFQINDADHYTVTRYDELSITLTYYTADNQRLVSLTTVAGVPYIYLQRLNDSVSLTSTQQFTSKDNTLAVSLDGSKYAARGLTANDSTFTLDERATLFAATSDADIQKLADTALNQIESVAVAYEKNSDTYQTKIDVKTSNNQPTVLGYLPHQKDSLGEITFTIPTIYGDQRFAKSNTFAFSTKEIDATKKLDVSKISATEREELVTILRQETNATKYAGIDTYYAGKELYRSAQLLQLAQQLNEPRIASTIQQKLRGEFQTWFAPAGSRTEKLFTYDTNLHSIVGLQASFGSNEGNDHHFHYGYFIHAASILASYDPTFTEEYGDMIDLLVADIANYKEEEDLPLRRSFDPYFGHSWASGSSPFGDGNNQESSSEAINAWIGTSLWAGVRGNNTLSEESGWMLSQEVASTQEYWLNDARNIGSGAYDHDIVSLNWGGKRDYSTFFSAEPGAKLGILLIPLAPAMQSENVLIRDRVQKQLEAISDAPVSAYNFQDYLLMYSSLTDPNEAVEKMRSFKDTDIDNANSRSYMYAWILSNR